MKPPHHYLYHNEELLRLYQHDMQEIWDKNILPHVYNSYHHDLEMYLNIAKTLKPERILDVGCAQGTLALLLGEMGFRVTALDLRYNFIKYATSRYEYGCVDFICADILSSPFISNTFDLVFAGQLIEHFVNPQDILINLNKVLKPCGYLVLTTPNHEYFNNYLPSYFELKNIKEYMMYQCSADGDSHFYAFTKNELVNILKNAGFKNVEVDYYGSPWITGHFKFRFLHRLIPFNFLKYLNNITLKCKFYKHVIGYQLIVVAKSQ